MQKLTERSVRGCSTKSVAVANLNLASYSVITSLADLRFNQDQICINQTHEFYKSRKASFARTPFLCYKLLTMLIFCLLSIVKNSHKVFTKWSMEILFYINIHIFVKIIDIIVTDILNNRCISFITECTCLLCFDNIDELLVYDFFISKKICKYHNQIFLSK